MFLSGERSVMETLKLKMWWWQGGTGFFWLTLQASSLLFFRRITLQTSTSSLTHLDVAAATLHQKGFWIPDMPIRCCQKVFQQLLILSQRAKTIASQIWILWGINREIWLQRWIYFRQGKTESVRFLKAWCHK